jgi:DNA-binding CsgD family transcriptional regulator
MGISQQTVKNLLWTARIKLGAKHTGHAIYLVYGQSDVTTA